jgi:hypothetical protein
MKAKKTTMIERDSKRGAYDLICERMILDHASLGRILISEGFGGMDSLAGGAYRYRHGMALRVPSTASLEGLDREQASVGPLHEIYEVLDWDGAVLQCIADSHA